MATGSSRSSGWKNRLHKTRPNRPGAGIIGRKGAPVSGDRNVERVHVGPRTGSAHDSGSAADMIRVRVSENEVLELVWRAAKPADSSPP
jgi:hypothetical protein